MGSKIFAKQILSPQNSLKSRKVKSARNGSAKFPVTKKWIPVSKLLFDEFELFAGLGGNWAEIALLFQLLVTLLALETAFDAFEPAANERNFHIAFLNNT